MSKKSIISYNINGIRAAEKKGFQDWIEQENPDVLCLQEVKASPEQISIKEYEDLGYHVQWHDAEKKGYSGVAILTKQKPSSVSIGCGIEKYDREGRVLRVDLTDCSIMSVYMPSGTTGDVRQDFKMEWLDDFQGYIDELIKDVPDLIISGDFNICHTPIDIHDPVRNKKSSGFLPEEREWLSGFINSGFIDSFRYFHEDEKDRYSWWSYRAGARKNNKGWRIDYNMVSESMKNRLHDADILDQVVHSDHCPVKVVIDNQ